MPVGRLDELITRLGKLTSATPRSHAGVMFDPKGGLGGIPDAANADYRGFTAYMRPQQFLQINPPRDLDERPISHILEAMDSGQPIGTPIVYVDRMPDRNWRVVGHEGRGRMSALQQRHPDSLFPVAVHPFGETRARHLAADDAFTWLMPDKGGDLPARGAAVLLNNQLRVSPADADFFNRYGTHPALEDLVRELSP
jgi:hypothetical protein